MMQAIYEPQGPAGEYAELACNLFTGDCPYKCGYCWAIQMNKRFGRSGPYTPRWGILEALSKEALQYAGDLRRVLLCFTGDPYPDDVLSIFTRRALAILTENGLQFTVLTKAPNLALLDYDLYQDGLGRLGATICWTNDEAAREWEPYAPPPSERWKALSKARSEGIYTWVSVEPVLDYDQGLAAIRRATEVADEVRVGRLNYLSPPQPIDWAAFAQEAVKILSASDCTWKLKTDLAAYLPEGAIRGCS